MTGCTGPAPRRAPSTSGSWKAPSGRVTGWSRKSCTVLTSLGDRMSSTSPIAPLAVREQLMTEPDLGAGNFLDHAVALNPNRAVPFAYSHSTDHRGAVVLLGHSLLDLVRSEEHTSELQSRE